MSERMIKISDIHRQYGKRPVLNGVSLTAAPGEIVAIVGRNGSGKTTLMQIIAGALKPDSGSISVFGADALADRKVFGRYIGYVPQEDPIFSELSVKDNLKFWAAGVKAPDDSVIDVFDLGEILNKPAGTLSGGMKRRLSIACAIQRKTPVLIMDEPTSALDIYYQDSIRTWMREYTGRNGLIILSTHSIQEIELADRVYVLDEGTARELDRDTVSENEIRREFHLSDR